jgi:hypothetical protein
VGSVNPFQGQAAAVVIGGLAGARCRSVEEMRLVNLLCRLIQYAGEGAA